MRSRSITALILLACSPAFAQAPAPAVAPAAPSPNPATPPAPAPAAVPMPAKGADLIEARMATLRQGQGLTSDEVARRAIRESALVEAKRRAIATSDAALDQAKAGYLPSLTLSASYTRLSPIDPPALGSLGGDGGLVVTATPTTGPRPIDPATEPLLAVPSPDFSFPVVLNSYTLAARLAIPLSDYLFRVARGVSAAEQSKQAASWELRAARHSVARDARVAYYQWIGAQAQRIIAEQAVEQAKGHYADAQNAFQAGLVSKADVLRAEAQVKTAELGLVRAHGAVNLTRTSLNVFLRDPGGQAYGIGEDVFAELPALDRLPAESAAYRQAVRARPELRALPAAEAALREQAKVAEAALYPRLDAQANALYANPNPRIFPQEEEFRATWDVGIVLSYTPTDLPAANAGAAQARARAAELGAQRKSLEDALRLEVARALESATQARQALAVSESVLVAAEESYRARRELFRAGRATLVEVTDAETELTRARIELVSAHIGARLAIVELDHALGRDEPSAPAAR